MVENEYRHNKAFRDYVDTYRSEKGLTIEEALAQEEIKRACLHYTDV